MKEGLKPARGKMVLSLLLNINSKGTALDRISARDSTGYRFLSEHLTARALQATYPNNSIIFNGRSQMREEGLTR